MKAMSSKEASKETRKRRVAGLAEVRRVCFSTRLALTFITRLLFAVAHTLPDSLASKSHTASLWLSLIDRKMLL